MDGSDKQILRFYLKMWRKSVKVDSRRASWNVRTGSFFIGIFGFSISLFFLLAMTLAHYNAIPAVIGMITYSFLIFAEFTGKPGFYLAFIGINVNFKSSFSICYFRHSESYFMVL
jgi:hypothetical protein